MEPPYLFSAIAEDIAVTRLAENTHVGNDYDRCALFFSLQVLQVFIDIGIIAFNDMGGVCCKNMSFNILVIPKEGFMGGDPTIPFLL